MSRTYRRKNQNWHFKKGCMIGLSYAYEADDVVNTEEYNKSRSIYHSDKRHYRSSVPSWFVNMFSERSLRRKTKRAIYNWTKSPDSDLMLPKYVHDAGYKYF